MNRNDGYTADTPMAHGQQLSKADAPDPGSPEQEAMKKIPYRSLVGGLLWITNSRPDIAYALGTLAPYGPTHGAFHGHLTPLPVVLGSTAAARPVERWAR